MCRRIPGQAWIPLRSISLPCVPIRLHISLMNLSIVFLNIQSSCTPFLCTQHRGPRRLDGSQDPTSLLAECLHMVSALHLFWPQSKQKDFWLWSLSMSKQSDLQIAGHGSLKQSVWIMNWVIYCLLSIMLSCFSQHKHFHDSSLLSLLSAYRRFPFPPKGAIRVSDLELWGTRGQEK